MFYTRLSFRVSFLSISAAILIASTPAAARPAVRGSEAQAAAQSPFLGKWELDLTRMPSTYGPPPTRVTYSFEDIGDGKWRTVVEIRDRGGGIRRGVVEYRRDGQAVPAAGNTGEADHVALNSPAPNVLVLCTAMSKVLTGVRTYAVSPDGREMTESAAGLDSSGVPFVRNFHYKRL